MAKRVKAVPTPKQEGYMTKELLGALIRARRTQEGLKMHDVAMLCGISIATLTNIEKAAANVRIDSVLQVAQMLGIKLTFEGWESSVEQ